MPRRHAVHVARAPGGLLTGCTSGAAALEHVGLRSYDVILCDVLMPEMTGIELYARVAASRPELLPRIVFMSAGAFSPGAREFLARVNNQRLDKPFEAAALRKLVTEFDETATETRATTR